MLKYRFLLFIFLLGGIFMSVPAEASSTHESRTVVRMETSKGDIIIELFDQEAPKTVKNFIGYIEDNFYEGTIFHRIIQNFMIQGGGFEAGLKQKATREPIINEATATLSNMRGTIAMARTADINSATAQFFINTVNNPALDHRNKTQQGYGYAVFGKVIEGLDIVDDIAAVKTGSSGYFQDVPKEDVVIKKVSILKSGEASDVAQ
jgi:cyclophilin family peptidyl-prolyl cis-trans isomerase